MKVFFSADHRTLRGSFPQFRLILLWLLGLCCGALFSVSTGDSFVSLMRSAPGAELSVFSLLGTLFLPFLISAVAVLLDTPILVYIICFVKGFLFIFVSAGICLAFPASGWLIRFLLMFSDICINPVLMIFMLHCFSMDKRSVSFSALSAAAYVLATVAVDHNFISPFLLEIFQN